MSSGDHLALPAWEALVVDAAGTAIDFWGFKDSHGRIWALLYMRGQSLTAAELQAALGLSKGAVSLALRELEHWHVVQRVRSLGSRSWRYEAETDFMTMISRVISEREAALLNRLRGQLERAEAEALAAKIPGEVLERLRRLRQLAQLSEQALGAFLSTAQLDARGVAQALNRRVRETVSSALRGRRRRGDKKK